jgi:short-subunit dehydrogenase
VSALANHVAVIVGACGGIGRAMALALASEGASLCLVGRTWQSLQALADLAATRSRTLCYRADLSVDREVDGFCDRLLCDVEGVDILVHAAGVIRPSRLETSTAQDLDDQLQVNFRAPYLITRRLLPSLRARHGQVVFVNSSAGLTAKANGSSYAASKHALKALADSLREEVNPEGVRVLSLFPGRTASPMQAAVHAMEGRAYRPQLLMQPEDVAAVAIHVLGLPRSVEVTDISLRSMVKSY